VTAALEAARSRGLDTIALLGRGGGDARTLADVPILIPSTDTARIQEVQMLVLHLLCELVETRIGVATAEPRGRPARRPATVAPMLANPWDGALRSRSGVGAPSPEPDGRN
jgi:DNA-binding MurR/RpiR family transcriptional regulator